MKIKRKVEMILPQLIEWGFENNVRNECFLTHDSEGNTSEVHFDIRGLPKFSSMVDMSDTFTVEVEEKITEDTKFKSLVKVTEAKNVFAHFDASINGVKHDTVVEIYALLNGKLESIWTHDKGLVE